MACLGLWHSRMDFERFCLLEKMLTGRKSSVVTRKHVWSPMLGSTNSRTCERKGCSSAWHCLHPSLMKHLPPHDM